MTNKQLYANPHLSLDEKLDNMSTATYLARFVAYIIDMIAIWGLMRIFIYPILAMLNVEDFHFFAPYLSLYNILYAFVFGLYFVLMTHFFRQTLGKMVMNISVQSTNNTPLTLKQILFRELIGKYISNFLLYLPYLMIFFTEKRIGLHDYFADTYIVNEKFDAYKSQVRDEYFRVNEKQVT